MTHEQECDKIVRTLQEALDLVYRVRIMSEPAAKALDGMCRHVSYEGNVLCISMESILKNVLDPE